MVALADSHGGVEDCLTTFLRPSPWVEDGSRPLPTLIFKVKEHNNIIIVGTGMIRAGRPPTNLDETLLCICWASIIVTRSGHVDNFLEVTIFCF